MNKITQYAHLGLDIRLSLNLVKEEAFLEVAYGLYILEVGFVLL